MERGKTSVEISANRYRRRWVTLGAIILTSFIGTWDGSALVIALPEIARQFNVGIDSAVLVLSVGSLLFAVPMAIFGKLGDMFGHRRIYLIAAASFAIFAALAGTAQTFNQLILFRALLGLASAPAFTATMALITTMFPREERGRAMGMMAAAASLAWAIGPLFGGLLMRVFSWQSIILVEIPFTLVAFGLAWWLMPEDSRKSSRPQFDLIGAGSLMALALILMRFIWVVGQGGDTGSLILLGSGFVVLAGVFFVTERRHKTPFVPLSLFANRRFSAATLFSMLQMVAMFVMLLLVPLYLREVAGVDPVTTGVLIAGLSIARVFFEPLAGRIAEFRGSRLPGLIGIGILITVVLSFTIWLSPRTPGWIIFVGMFIFGVGFSLGRTPVNTAVTYLVNRERLGLALGVFSMLTFSIASLGQTFFGVLLRGLSGAGNVPLSAVPLPDVLNAFTICFIVLTGVLMLAGVFGLRLPDKEMMRNVAAAHD